MHNKKIMAKGVALGLIVFNTPINSTANAVKNYNIDKEESIYLDSNKEDRFLEVKESINNFFENLFNKDDNKVNHNKSREMIKLNPNIRTGTVLEITLADNQFVQDLSGNTQGYETVRVTTKGSKKLVKADYDKLRLSGIPKIDLSNAYSDVIPAGAFTNATWLTEFKFPKGVSTIEDGEFIKNSNAIGDYYYSGPFYNCSNLTGNLIIPDTVTYIGEFAFYECSGFTGNLVLPDNITAIGDFAFSGCSGFTGSLVIPGSLKTMGQSVFGYCSGFDGNLTIQDGVTTIGEYAFYECSGFTGNLIIPDSVVTVANGAFAECTGFNGKLVISKNVSTIESGVFWRTGFTGDLIIPNNVTSIGPTAFFQCRGFTGDLVIPDGVESIQYQAFDGCTGFSSLSIPDSVTTIEEKAFVYCSGLTGYYVVSDNIQSIGEDAFFSTKLDIIVKVSENDVSSNYKKTLITSFNTDDTYGIYIDMPYELAIGTWIENSKYKLTTHIDATYGELKNNQGVLCYLEINAPYSEENIYITRNGEKYNLPELKDGKYLFEEEGDYIIKVVNSLGTTSNVSFKNTLPINPPEIQYIDGRINIKDNKSMSIGKDVVAVENFNDINNIEDSKIPFVNDGDTEWYLEDGVLKSQIAYDEATIAGAMLIESNLDSTVKVKVKCTTNTLLSSMVGVVMYNSDMQVIDSYIDDGVNNVGYFNDYRVLELKIKKGTNILMFMSMDSNALQTGESGQFMVDFIEVYGDEKVEYIPSEVLEYRINNGEWQPYANSFELNYPDGTKLEIEARAKHNGFVSPISKKEIVVKSENMILERLDASANLDIYIKNENILSLSLDTSSITFENFSGIDDMEELNAIKISVNSSLPYKINAYMPTEIQNSDGTNIMNRDILNIRANGQNNYNTFRDTTTPILLFDDQSHGNDKIHGIDLMLKSNTAHAKDVYKTTIKLEVEQK